MAKTQLKFTRETYQTLAALNAFEKEQLFHSLTKEMNKVRRMTFDHLPIRNTKNAYVKAMRAAKIAAYHKFNISI